MKFSLFSKKDKLFVSDLNWFTILLPENWERYEDEEGTYAFFDVRKWKGNFRITPLQYESTKKGEPQIFKFDSNDNNRETIGSYDCLYFTEECEEDKSVIYYWKFVIENFVFICSFTINSELSISQTQAELNKARKIIESLRLCQ